MKTHKLSHSADMRIRRQLFIAQLKKNFASFGALKLALPALAIGVFALGMFQMNNIQQNPSIPGKQALSEVQQGENTVKVNYGELAKVAESRAVAATARKYSRYSQVRLAKLRVQ